MKSLKVTIIQIRALFYAVLMLSKVKHKMCLILCIIVHEQGRNRFQSIAIVKNQDGLVGGGG